MADSTLVQVEQQKQALLQQIDAAAQDPTVPKFYINGFSVGRTLGDLFFMMMYAGKAVGIVSMSFTTAKTLEQHLHNALTELEQQIGQEILSMDDIQKKMQGPESSQNE